MKNFWKAIADAALNGAVQGLAASAGDTGVQVTKVTGMAAGAGAVAGILSYLLQHPLGQHPAVQASVAASAPKPAA